MASDSKKKFVRLLLFAIAVLFIFCLTPPGVRFLADSTADNIKSGFARTIFVKATDLLWIYGDVNEVFDNYTHLLDELEELETDEHEDMIKYSLAMMGRAKDEAKEYDTAKKLYQIWKARWPEDQDQITKIDKRLTRIIGTIAEEDQGEPAPDWINEMHKEFVKN